MKLVDAIRAAERDPETPQPVSGGLCEYTVRGFPCGARGRWWYRDQRRCNEHKNAS